MCTHLHLTKVRHLLSNVGFNATLLHLYVLCLYIFLNKHFILAEIATYTVFLLYRIQYEILVSQCVILS